MIPLTHPQYVDSLTFDTAKPIISHTYKTLYITTLLILFKLDLLLSGYKKSNEEPLGKFL